jgi:phage head maturation protease
MTTLTQSPAAEIAPRSPVELRSSNLAGVNFAQRTIEVIAVPYDELAPVEYRGELWNESFARGAFDGIERRPNPIRANRDHDKRRTVGKIVDFWPSRQEGLVASVRVARTELGDETLVLADEDCLGASVGSRSAPRIRS